MSNISNLAPIRPLNIARVRYVQKSCTVSFDGTIRPRVAIGEDAAAMSVDRGYVEANALSRERLARLSGHGDIELARGLSGGWTVAALLAHIAFWDGWAGARWDQYQRDGSLDGLSDTLQDLANRAAMPQWLALPPRRALALAVEAAERLDARLEKLADEAVAHALETGCHAMIDRALHRVPHLEEIEQSLAG